MINPNTKVVPIDHGWANMKTEQDVFTSGVSEITTEPALFNDVLEYNNKYYKIGGKRLEVKEDKVHERLSALNALLNMDEKGDDGIGMDDDAPEQNTSGQDVQKPERKESVADKPVMRVSLKERLENMKQKVAGMDKHEKVKAKEEVR